ncbi:phytoene desaturase family protein [Labilibaculum euxinus]
MDKEKYDIVIVGSGLGGLTCAYILGKFGYKVCVLEKHFKTGGNLQTFKRKGCRFDTGMHYVGSLGEGEVLHKFFNYLDLLGKVDARKLDEDAFDVINIAGREYNYAMGYEKFTQSLLLDFPNEETAILAYVGKIRMLSESSDIFNLRQVDLMDTSNMSYYGQSTSDFIASLTENIELRSVLTALNPLYGGGEQTTPLYVHALVNHFFITSAWRLTEGGDQISDALVTSIQGMGGKVLTKSEVVKFHFAGKLMSAVETENGNLFEAEHFISNMHPSVTMDLVPDEKIRKSYKSRLTNLKNTISAFSVYIVLKKNKIPYLNKNYYYYKTNNVWGVDNYDKGDWPQGLMLYFAADKNNPEYAESVTIITYMKYEEVVKWEGTKIECRGEEYLAFKAEKEREVMACVSEVFPDILDAVDTSYTSSPLSFKDYTGTKEGSMYGIARDCNNPIESYLPSRTKISNLLLTGQSVNLHGITGVLCGALLTCGQLVDINAILQDINSCYPEEYKK